MRKIFSLILVSLLSFPMTACGQNKAEENGTAGGIETIPATDTIEAVQETGTVPDDTNSEPAVEGETIIRAEFDFERGTVMLNSGYEMPINGLGTYSLHGDVCINSVKSALSNGVRLIDTASAYGNEEEIGQAIREAIDEGIIQREDIFVTTKIYPGSEMENPVQSIQACLDRLDIGYVDLMLLHHPDPNDVEAYKAMEQFVEEGKIRSIGLSNWYVEELTEFLPQVDTVPAVVQNLQPLFVGVGSGLVVLFFVTGFCAESVDIKSEFRFEAMLRMLIRLGIAQWLVANNLTILKAFFSSIGAMVSHLGNTTMAQAGIGAGEAEVIENLGFATSLVFLILSVILSLIILICGFFIIYTVYFRFLKIMVIVPLAAIAFSTLAGNRVVSGTCVRYFKYFLSVMMEAVTMALAILICNAFISAGLPSFTGGYADWAQVLIYLCEITFTIALTVGACKGAQSLTGRALGL